MTDDFGQTVDMDALRARFGHEPGRTDPITGRRWTVSEERTKYAEMFTEMFGPYPERKSRPYTEADLVEQFNKRGPGKRKAKKQNPRKPGPVTTRRLDEAPPAWAYWRYDEPAAPVKPVKVRYTIGTTQWATPMYKQALAQVGARTVVVDERTRLSALNEFDGLLIPGGRDVDPSWYGEQPDKRTSEGNKERDALELALIRYAVEHDLPLLGVCRGHQLLNVALGGSLVQHIDRHLGNKHAVNIAAGSRHLGFIDPARPLVVNSLHHQAVNRVGEGLEVVATADDGTVEAVEHRSKRFVVGVQWHPERALTPRFERTMRGLLHRFVSERQA